MTDIPERAFQFGIRIVKMVEALPRTTAGFAVGNQIIRSGTAIGAILKEATSGLSYNDFVNLLRSARKEAKETNYWLNLITSTNLLPSPRLINLERECREIIKILSKSIKTSEERQGDHKITRHKSQY